MGNQKLDRITPHRNDKVQGKPQASQAAPRSQAPQQGQEAVEPPVPAYYRQLFRHAPLAVAFMDDCGNILDINPSFTSLFGYGHDEVTGRKSKDSIVSGNYFLEAAGLLSRIMTGESVTSETVRKHKSNKLIPVRIHGHPVRHEGKIIGACAIYEDLSEKKALESELRTKSYFDDLTGLPNAEYLVDNINRSRGSRPDGSKVVIVLIGLDRFRRINASLGHAAGDQALVEIASRIRKVSRFQDMQARCGGDRFAVLLSGLNKRREAEQVARRYLAVIEKPMIVDGTQISVGASIGVVFGAEEYDDANEVLNDADIALQNAKKSNGSRVQVFIPPMHEQVAATSQMELDMEMAVAENAFDLAYQPVVLIGDGMLQGFEALLRWDHPTMGAISPERFIPLAEESGMIAGLGRWVLARALGDLGKLSKAAGHELSMNVNLSVKQLFMDELEGFIAGLLQKHDIRPERLHLEITESVIMHSELLPKLEALRDLGAKIGIDDFGTGYSSLGYLKDMPIDFLKIDKSFVSGQGKADKEIVTTLINLADRLNLEVVAEGVESLEQMDQLRDMGCKLGQGFYFSKPVPQDLACRLPQQFR